LISSEQLTDVIIYVNCKSFVHAQYYKNNKYGRTVHRRCHNDFHYPVAQNMNYIISLHKFCHKISCQHNV